VILHKAGVFLHFLINIMQVSVETAKELGILPEEFEKIKEYLGRVPNFTELSVYSVMWSEHCSYKNSIVWLKTLPKEGKRMLAKPVKKMRVWWI
jgi:phosphoribosylformylglycinamidine synthase